MYYSWISRLNKLVHRIVRPLVTCGRLTAVVCYQSVGFIEIMNFARTEDVRGNKDEIMIILLLPPTRVPLR